MIKEKQNILFTFIDFHMYAISKANYCSFNCKWICRQMLSQFTLSLYVSSIISFTT